MNNKVKYLQRVTVWFALKNFFKVQTLSHCKNHWQWALKNTAQYKGFICKHLFLDVYKHITYSQTHDLIENVTCL